jgi:regulator of sigma D
MVDVKNALVKKRQVAFKNIVGLNAFVNKEQWSAILDEGRLSCQACNDLVDYLPAKEVSLL